MYLKKVQPGDRLDIPAPAWNLLMDVGADWVMAKHNQRGGTVGSLLSSGIVRVQNNSDSAVDQFNILGIDTTPVIDPSQSEDAFKQNPVILPGVTPAAVPPSGGGPVHLGKFVITLEPIASGDIGLALVSGVCIVQVNMASQYDRFADVSDQDTTMLASGPDGGAQVLWVASGTGQQWAIVRIGNRSPAVFPAKLTGVDSTDAYKYQWQEETIGTDGTFSDLDGGRMGDGSGSGTDLGLAWEFNQTTGLYTQTPTVYVLIHEMTDGNGDTVYRFIKAPPAVLFGSLTADWDPNPGDNYFTVNPCDADGGNADSSTTVKVYMLWPKDATHLSPGYACLKQGNVIAYMDIGKDSDGNPEGAALRTAATGVWGKLTADWNDGDNFVMVRIVDAEGNELGVTADQKVWLFSPHSQSDIHGVTLHAGDMIPLADSAWESLDAINVMGGGGSSKLLDGKVHTDTIQADAANDAMILGQDDSGTPKWGKLDPQDNSILAKKTADDHVAWLSGTSTVAAWKSDGTLTLPTGGANTVFAAFADADPVWATSTNALLGWDSGSVLKAWTSTGPAVIAWNSGGNLDMASAGVNELFYFDANQNPAFIASANSAVLLTDANGVPHWAGTGANAVLVTFADANPVWTNNTNAVLGWDSGSVLKAWTATGPAIMAWNSAGNLDMASGGANEVFYFDANQNPAFISSVSSAALLTDANGVPAWSAAGANAILVSYADSVPVWSTGTNAILGWDSTGALEKFVGDGGPAVVAWNSGGNLDFQGPGGANEIFYFDANQNPAFITSANNAALVTDASGNPSFVTGTSTVLAWDSGGNLAPVAGGANQLFYFDSNGNPAALGVGAEGQVLKWTNGVPTWVDPVQIKVVTGVRYDAGSHQLLQTTQTLKIIDTMDDSSEDMIPGGQAVVDDDTGGG